METLVYAVKHKDPSVLKSSSSGGVFSALTEKFICSGNAVLCVHYNYESDQAEFHIIETLKNRNDSRGSMYMQSIAQDSWNDAYEWLEKHKTKCLMFVGVGCQAAAFIKFSELKKIRDRIVVVDLICHGVPSPLVWKRYIEFLKGDGQLDELNFRDKRTGWSRSVGTVKINGKDVSLGAYRRLYSSRNTLRPCCSQCPYTCIDRCTDVTMGDFWNLEKSMPDFVDENGVSLVLIHTEKGQQIFDSILDMVDVRKSNKKDCWQLNLEKPTEHASSRKEFWIDFDRKGIQYVMKKYGNVSTVCKIRNKIKKIFWKDEHTN